MQSGSLENLYLLRRSLELGAIDLAIRNASDQQIAELAALAERYARVPTGKAGVRQREKLGLAFHRTIMAATGNAFLKDLAEVIDVYFSRGAREMEGWAAMKDKTTHLRIAEAFKARDARGAWELMHQHLPIWSTDGRVGMGGSLCD